MPVGRFAPSPTGRLHVGNLRTAIVAWLFARTDQSSFFLRFEDLDTAAVRDEHYQTQVDDLLAIGLDWDEPVIKQSDRLAHYQAALDRLTAQDQVYPCYCSRKEVREAASAPNLPHAGHHYPGTCRSLSTTQRAERALTRDPALRVRSEGVTRGFVDRVVGSCEFAVDDFVVKRNDGTPAYHLVVVIDDAAQGIELVVRADDLLESTSRHLLLYELLELNPPDHAHVPLVLAENGDRLAKRHGAVNLDDRAERGESADEVSSFLAATLGLAKEGESVTMEQVLERFEPTGLPVEPLYLLADYL